MEVDVGCDTSLVERQIKGTDYSGGDGPIHMLTYLNANRTERHHVPWLEQCLEAAKNAARNHSPES